MRILWTPAGLEETRNMAPHLRKADKREWRTITGNQDVTAMLLSARAASTACFVGRDDETLGDPFVIYGVVKDPYTEGMGAIWLAATSEIHAYRRALLRDVPERIQWIQDQGWFPRGLHNLVDTRNTIHLKWLKQMGAIMPKGKIVAICGVPFQYFTLS